MSTSHSKCFLKGESKSSQSVNQLIKGKYDLAIVFSSWDKRSVCITESQDIFSTHCITVLFSTRDTVGLRDKHDKILSEYFSKHSNATHIITGLSVDVNTTWKIIYDKIISIKNKLDHSLKIFLDLSSCTKYYALAILGTCLKEGIAKSITIFYAEGIYGKEISTEQNFIGDTNFTKGHWKTVQIPSFEGEYYPENKKFYLVSVGFEGAKTMQVLAREDPDRVSILFPKPGVIEKYEAETYRSNERLFHRYKIPEDHIINVPAGDAIAVWKFLDNLSVERPDKENTYYFCCGTKPHAIGLGLRAICEEHPAVIYRIPEKHNVTDIKPNNTFWCYKITDLSALP